jgi:hypothetical protein
VLVSVRRSVELVPEIIWLAVKVFVLFVRGTIELVNSVIPLAEVEVEIEIPVPPPIVTAPVAPFNEDTAPPAT